ncbi:MAG: hypothetical protein K9M19_02840, partial [Candidatus Marinimicrobia bacterium]|nr:hypothetical protein [Candidatus Neomarinimicrobiota bacterium]
MKNTITIKLNETTKVNDTGNSLYYLLKAGGIMVNTFLHPRKELLLLGFLLIGTGCQFKDPDNLQGGIVHALQALAKDAAFQIQMDETSYTFAFHPPLGIQQQNDDELFLQYFQKRREIFSIDEYGYVSSTIECLEGNMDMNIPKSIWDETKAIRPAESLDTKHITTIKIADGIFECSGPTGVLYSDVYDPDELRIL